MSRAHPRRDGSEIGARGGSPANPRRRAMMSMKKIIRAAALVATLSIPVAACDLVVEPTEQVSPEIATGSLDGVRALLAGIYNRLQHGDKYGSHMLLVPEILADNARTSDPPVNFQGEYLNQIGDHLEDWETRYQTINEANFVIASAQELASSPAANRVLGEALFLRALNYFDLARIFAYEPNQVVAGWDRGVVLRSEPTRSASEADFKPRASVQETYEFIEDDLLRAVDLLAVDGTSGPYFANEAAAEALLARLYLYWERWSDAATYATRAMEHTSARLASASEYPTMFLRQPNIESLFELNYDPATESLWVNVCMACYTHEDGTWFSIWPTDELLALFEDADVRNEVFPTADNGVRFVNKYAETVGDNTDNSPIIRYAELLLIRAEAYAEMGQEAQARADLDRLRGARNAGPVAASGAALVQEILDERRRELNFEGHRWFDLKRRGMDIPKPAHSGNAPLAYTDFRILAPIPSTEVQNNPELEQNPGY